jgi:hypothetical protein
MKWLYLAIILPLRLPFVVAGFLWAHAAGAFSAGRSSAAAWNLYFL